MNLSANMLGLANAATPFGLKAMTELNKLNSRPGVATNSMALFMAINNSGVAILQLGVVATRAIVGSRDLRGREVPDRPERRDEGAGRRKDGRGRGRREGRARSDRRPARRHHPR